MALFVHWGTKTSHFIGNVCFFSPKKKQFLKDRYTHKSSQNQTEEAFVSNKKNESPPPYHAPTTGKNYLASAYFTAVGAKRIT